MTDTLVIDPSGINLIVPCQRAGKASKRLVGGPSYGYSGGERSHIRAQYDVLPIVFVNATPADCRTIEATFALGAQVECAGTVFNRDDAGTTVVVCSGDYTDDMEQGGGYRVPGITLREVGSGLGGLGGTPMSVSPDDTVPTSELVFHYDAQALVGISNGQPLTLWPDESGNGNDAPAGNPSFPGYYQTGVMNGHPAIRFDALGNNQRGYDLPITYAPDEGEAFIVMQKAPTGGGAFWHWGETATGPSCPTGSGGTFRDDFGSTIARSFAMPVDPLEPFVYHVRSRAGQFRAWVNGVLVYNSDTNTPLWAGTSHFGMWLSGGAFYSEYIGWIGELKVRSSWMADSDAAAEDATLLAKWS